MMYRNYDVSILKKKTNHREIGELNEVQNTLRLRTREQIVWGKQVVRNTAEGGDYVKITYTLKNESSRIN